MSSNARHRKREILALARARPCLHCGKIGRTTLHHTWPWTGRKHINSIKSIPQLEAELKKVIPLCYMCHAVRHLLRAEG